MLERKIAQNIAQWHAGKKRKALMLTGARQVGKTTAVRDFARSSYAQFAEFNFLLDPLACEVFSGPLDADSLVANMTAYLRQPLEPGRTLVLLDEIQNCPAARTAIKPLVEDGRFDYIETGSLLGVRVNDVASFPVGFEETVRVYPMDFEEFCLACGVQPQTIELLRERFAEKRPVDPAMHETMMRLFRTYVVVGGMPEVVQRYVETHDIAQVLHLQHDLLSLYRQDIARYANDAEKTKAREIFDAIPSQLNDQNRRFVLADLSKNARQNRYQSSFLWLADAGVTLPCFNIEAPVAPLATAAQRNLFKLFMCDAGLLCCTALGNVQSELLSGKLDVNLGSITENVVAQELAAHGFDLGYFNSKKTGEVDFVVQRGHNVLPIEVKSGNDWKRHHSLDVMLATEGWDIPEAYVLCKGNVELAGRICYLPLYMCMFIEQERLPEKLIFEVDLSGL